MGSQNFCTLLARDRTRVPSQGQTDFRAQASCTSLSDTAEGKAHRIVCGMFLTKKKQSKPGFLWKNYLQGHVHSTVSRPLGHPGKIW